MSRDSGSHADDGHGLTAEWRSLLLRDRGDDCKTAVLIANRIEEAMLAGGWQCGHAIGSLASIMREYDVGRSIARETMRVLELRGTGSLRRGPGGGVLVGRPDLTRAALSLAGLLVSRGATIGNLAQARRVLDREFTALGLAAQRATGANTARETIEYRIADDRSRAICSRNPGFILFGETLDILCRSILDQACDHGKATLLTSAGDREGNDFELLAAALGLTPDRAFCEIARLDNVDPHLTTGPHAIRIARHLADLVIQGTWRGGERIGTEQELAERYDVGLLVVRQAIRLVEEHGVAEIRLGRGNGLFVSESRRALPAIRMAHGYLASRHWAGRMWWQAIRPIQVALLDAAIREMTPAERQTQRTMVADLGEDPVPGRAMDAQMRIMRRLSMSSRNPVLEIFWTVVLSYRHRVMTNVSPHARSLMGHLVTKSQTFLVDFLAGRADASAYYAVLSASLLPEFEDWVGSPFGVNLPPQ